MHACKASTKPVYLHYSAARHDHFSSSGPNPPAGYVTMGLQGYLLDTAKPGAVPMAWYYSNQDGDSTTHGDNVLAQMDGPNPPHMTSCTHAISTAADCFAAARGLDSIGNATVKTAEGASVLFDLGF